MAIRCFVLDDEPLATDLLNEYISRLPDLTLVGVSNSPTPALHLLQQTPVLVSYLRISYLEEKLPQTSLCGFINHSLSP